MKTNLLALLALALPTLAGEVVSWSPVSEATGYRVYYASSSGGPWAVMAATSGLSATNALTGTWWYYVVSTNACCESNPSALAHRPGSPGGVKVVK